MALYDRLLGHDDAGVRVEGKIPVHAFQATLAEFGRGSLTGLQAEAVVASVSGLALTTGEKGEAQTLLATVTGTAVQKLARAKEIDDVLLLAELNATGYETPTQVKARLGV